MLRGTVPLKFAVLVLHLFYPDPNCLCGPAKPNVACPPDGTFGAKESGGKTYEGGAGGVDVTRCGEGRQWILSGLGLYEVVPSGLDDFPSFFFFFLCFSSTNL